MLETFDYINHLGEELKFGAGKIFANSNELHDFLWDIKEKNARIYSFSKGIQSKKLPVLISCDSEEKGLKIRNELYEICEKDVIGRNINTIEDNYGRIRIGNYYLRCYITASSKTEYLNSKKQMSATLTISTDYPYWVREIKHKFGYGHNESDYKYLDFPYDFSFDYGSPLIDKAVNNTGIISTNFKMVIYGEAISPQVTVGENVYRINADVGENEYLTIDSSIKKIYLTKEDGTVVNYFNYRDKENGYYIFEKIKAGASIVTLENCNRVDITVYDERSEPKWI